MTELLKVMTNLSKVKADLSKVKVNLPKMITEFSRTPELMNAQTLVNARTFKYLSYRLNQLKIKDKLYSVNRYFLSMNLLLSHFISYSNKYLF